MNAVLAATALALCVAAGFPRSAAGADAAHAGPRPPPLAPERPVIETLWGQEVADPYRYMESMDAVTTSWMSAQGAYARAMLDAIPQRPAVAARVAEFTNGIGLTRNYASYGGRAIYEERAPGADDFNVVVRDTRGKRTVADLAAMSSAAGGTPHAVNFSLASPDGRRVAVGISAGGSEAAALYVYDTVSGRRVAGPLERCDPGFIAWRDDSRRLYVTRLKKLRTGDAETEKYRDAEVVSWDLRSEPVPILGSKAGRGPSFAADETPALTVWPGAQKSAAVSYNGVQNEIAMWLAPANALDAAAVKWSPFVTREDGVIAAAAAADTIYLLSHHGAPTFQVLAVRSGDPLARATVAVPARSDRVLDGIHVAADALYVRARQGVYSVLLRVPHGSTTVEEIALPFKGVVEQAFADPRTAGITISLENFVTPPRTFAFDPARGRFSDLALGGGARDQSTRYEIVDLEARAYDGVMVPNTVVRPAGTKGPQVLLIQAYGAYGYSQVANFSTRAASLLAVGGAYASCHVRGGGELGEAWRLAGKDANKPNSWRDLISCAEDLIARGYTSRDKLFVFSGSAGGITIGRAMTERPDLFAGVLALVPGVNTLRQEFQPNGPLNVPEFGSITTEQGFRNLYSMDTLQHIRRGVRYPPTLITTGLNDARVASWEPAKFAAALQASGSSPVLLRIDADAGHGMASTKSQDDALFSDMWAFVFWRAGVTP